MEKPKDFKVSLTTKFEVADSKPKALIYFTDTGGASPAWHWIEGMDRLRSLHRWLGKVIEHFEKR